MDYSKVTYEEIIKVIGDIFYKKQKDRSIKIHWGPKQAEMFHEAMRKEIGEKLEINKKQTMATYTKGLTEHIATEEALQNMYPGQKITKTRVGKIPDNGIFNDKEFHDLLIKGESSAYISNELNSDGYTYNIKAGSTGDLECFPDSVTYNHLMTKEEIKEKYPLESYSMQMVDFGEPMVDPSDTYTYNGYHGMVKNAMGDFVEVDFESFLDYNKDYKITTSKMIGEAVLYGTKNNITRSIKLYNGSVNPRYFIDFRICNQG